VLSGLLAILLAVLPQLCLTWAILLKYGEILEIYQDKYQHYNLISTRTSTTDGQNKEIRKVIFHILDVNVHYGARSMQIPLFSPSFWWFCFWLLTRLTRNYSVILLEMLVLIIPYLSIISLRNIYWSPSHLNFYLFRTTVMCFYGLMCHQSDEWTLPYFR
jgi:hypothetical protein